MKEWEALRQYWEENQDLWKDSAKEKQTFYQAMNKKIAKTIYNFTNYKRISDTLIYQMRTTHYIEDNGDVYEEEQLDWREAKIVNGNIVEDQPSDNLSFLNKRQQMRIPIDTDTNRRFNYDRRKAVQYADRWWNDANPEYHFFEVNDCTNYISQCLRAGGAPMRGQPNRSEGWWYSGDNWSFSWSVAHSFRWYLSESTIGLKGKRLDNPTDLLPGDVICYDFQGDGRFDHTTIVVRKDSENMPLVNAHTNNSRNRYWTYEDSMAWTPNCEYIFFRIGNDD
ncbi:hypothetical protein GGQ92_000947 [Gracilibacillus halotolerans]|uniref:Putative amidase domain-containing protein n=1 Tax=Gracilibacillus halotolerans TaxID=74386 RepID=A0A841RL29_9BACI|nr:amidase domain-containing protein [Gracilibacillus halotolerans]MBB6512166.1 hypothetical protein [Gracilibacillus halotolerans]